MPQGLSYNALLLHNEVEALEILVEGGRAIENLVTAGTDGQLVDGLVIILESLGIEGDGGRGGLTGLQVQLLEAFQGFDGSTSVVECLDIDLHSLSPLALAGIGDGNRQGDSLAIREAAGY